MRNLKLGVRLNLVSLAALVGLALVLVLALFRLDAVMRSEIEDRTRKTVEIAYSTIEHYQKLEEAGKLSRADAQVAARDALRAMRYGGNEYFFALNTQSEMVVHPLRPDSEGTPVNQHFDADGQAMFKQMVDVVRGQNEGFVEYDWKAPGSSESEVKLAYVKGFMPWGWIVGTGIYVGEIRAAVTSAAISLGSIVLVVLAAMGTLNWLLSRSISVPVAALTGRMRTMAAGELESDIPGLDRGDEVGDMARALAVFRDNANAKAHADAAKSKSEADQRFVVDTVSSQLARVSDGDLTAEIKAEFPAAYAALKTNFNNAVGGLRDLIAGLSLSAEAIRSGSDEIAQASDDLARRTESNAASLEEASAALSQMEERLRITATSAASTADRTSDAKTIVGEGRTTADEAVGAMGRVAGGAQGIDSVIEGLDKIAFQTQVLAMNAAVEAGRAGEAGRGFAVVADLVSALARRSEEEARRAREELTATQADIATAVDAVHKVDGALANIMDSVEQVHDLVATMAADNQAQSATISEITIAVSTMDTSTQQNAAMVEETSAATRNLASEVALLSESASRFKTGAAMPIKTYTPAATPASVPASMSAATPNYSAADDDWADF